VLGRVFYPVVDDEKIEHQLGTGRGAWDEGREKWEGEAPAEPKRRQMAIGDWRLATG